MTIREAKTEDIQQLQFIRNSVKENALSNPDLVTYHDYETYINVKGRGWVCELDNRIVGFAIVDLKENNIWALFITPEFESKGIGKALHDRMLEWYFMQTKEKVWLSTAFDTRAAKFYKIAGWTEVGMHGTKEVKFEMAYDDWEKRTANNR